MSSIFYNDQILLSRKWKRCKIGIENYYFESQPNLDKKLHYGAVGSNVPDKLQHNGAVYPNSPPDLCGSEEAVSLSDKLVHARLTSVSITSRHTFQDIVACLTHARTEYKLSLC